MRLGPGVYHIISGSDSAPAAVRGDDPWGRGGRDAQLPARGGQQRYRTKLEVLGDFLGAVRRSPRKTRIVGLANLNPTSFDKYLGLCVSLELVEARSGGYYLTTRAAGALDALARLVAKSSETDRAVDELRRILGTPSDPEGEELTLRWISRQAWSELALSLPGDPISRTVPPLIAPASPRPSPHTSGGWSERPGPRAAAERSPLPPEVRLVTPDRVLAPRRRRRR